jgi:hypothetical protein
MRSSHSASTEKEALDTVVNSVLESILNLENMEEASPAEINAIMEKLLFMLKHVTASFEIGMKAQAAGKKVVIAADDLLPFTISLLPNDPNVLKQLQKKLDQLSNLHRDHGESGYALANLYIAVSYKASQYDEKNDAAQKDKIKMELEDINKKAEVVSSALSTIPCESSFERIAGRIKHIMPRDIIQHTDEIARRLQNIFEANDANSAALAYAQFGEMIKKIIPESSQEQFKQNLALALTGLQVSPNIVTHNHLVNAAIGDTPIFTDSTLENIHTGLSFVEALIKQSTLNQNVQLDKVEIAKTNGFLFNNLIPNTPQRVKIEDAIYDMRMDAQVLPPEQKAKPAQLAQDLQRESNKYFVNPIKNEQALNAFKNECNNKVRAADAELRAKKTPSSFLNKLENFLVKIDAVKLVRFFRDKGLFAKSASTLNVEVAVNKIRGPKA